MHDRQAKRKPHRSLIWIAGSGPILAALLATAPPTLAAPAEGARREAVVETSKSSESLHDVPTPPGVHEEELAPPTGPRAARLRQTLEAVIADMPDPPVLTAKAEDRPDEEPPLAAQIAYARGREAWHARRGTDALRSLQAAQRLAPKEPAIARLLGQVYGALGNRGQAALFLEQAVRLEPGDVQTLFMLGALYAEQGNTARAVPILVAALDAMRNDATADTVLDPVIRFALARALDEAGYAAAAIAQYEAIYNQRLQPDHSTQFGRQLYEIEQSRTGTWVRIGDAYHRLGQPREALVAYETAASDDAEAHARLLPRLLYTQLRLGGDARAQQLVIDALRQGSVTTDKIDSLRYVSEHIKDRSTMAGQLRAIYDADPRNEQLALAMASILTADESLALLREHMAGHPDDLKVYRQIVDSTLRTQAPEATQKNRLALVRLAIKLITDRPEKAADYALTPAEPALREALLTVIDTALPDAERNQPAAQLIRATQLAAMDRDDEAIASLRLAVADEKLMAAKVSLTRLLVDNKRYDEASEYLEGLANAEDPQIALLRVRVLASSDQLGKALELLDSLIKERPNDSVDLVLEKANLLVNTGDPANKQLAESSLLTALDTNPDSEALFRALFSLYENAPQGIPNVVQQREKLLRRLVSVIPESRLGKVKRAQSLLRSNDPSSIRQAEAILRQLIAENAKDYEAFSSWLTLMVITDRMGQATDALEARLRESPDDVDLLAAAQSFYRGVGDQAKVYEVAERLLLLSEPSFERTTYLIEIYMRTEQFAKALPLLMEAMQSKALEEPRPYLYRISQALVALGRADEFDAIVTATIERFPALKLEIQLTQASHYSRVGNRDKAEAIKVGILKDNPRHAPTNNDLGYTWADRGVNLKEAERMIDIAVKEEPGNMAYLDSMGWVLYKQGKFGEAIVWLQRSLDAAEAELRAGNASVLGTLAVVTDHMADAHYRNNDHAKANQLWARALIYMRRVQVKDDPELEALDDRLRAKIEALRGQRDVLVAPVPAIDVPNIAPEDGVPQAPR